MVIEDWGLQAHVHYVIHNVIAYVTWVASHITGERDKHTVMTSRPYSLVAVATTLTTTDCDKGELSQGI